MAAQTLDQPLGFVNEAPIGPEPVETSCTAIVHENKTRFDLALENDAEMQHVLEDQEFSDAKLQEDLTNSRVAQETRIPDSEPYADTHVPPGILVKCVSTKSSMTESGFQMLPTSSQEDQAVTGTDTVAALSLAKPKQDIFLESTVPKASEPVPTQPSSAQQNQAHGQLSMSPEMWLTNPPHPSDPWARATTLQLEQKIISARQCMATPKQKRKLLKRMFLRVHPDKGGDAEAFDWLAKWRRVHYKWFLADTMRWPELSQAMRWPDTASC